MSTRSTTHFTDGRNEPYAIVYRHHDGYPEGHGVDLHRFFTTVEGQTSDTRFNDPTYLAAKLVVYLADQFGTGLDFLGVGVCMSDPGDIEYIYTVDCSKSPRPDVRCYEVEHPNGWDAPAVRGKEVPIPLPV